MTASSESSESPESPVGPPPSAPSEETAPPPAPGFGGRLLLYVGLLTLLFGTATASSWLFRSFLFDPSVSDPAGDGNLGKKPETNSPAEMLARGDEALYRHRFADALNQYSELVRFDTPSGSHLQYRRGLCYESLGQGDRAIAAYREAIRGTSSQPLSFACHLGMARCFLRQRHHVEARQLLYPLLFDELRQRGVPESLISDARYFGALSLAREAHPPTASAQSLDTFVPFSFASLEVPHYLDELAEAARNPNQGANAAAKTPEPAPTIVMKKRNASEPADVLRAVVPASPVKDLVDKLAKEAGIKPRWTAKAEAAIVDRKMRLDVSSRGLEELLEQIADSVGLVGRSDNAGDGMVFSQSEEMNGKTRGAARKAMAERALKSAAKADAMHPLANAVFLELGNAAAQAGLAADAMAWYDRIVREPKGPPFAVLAYFNRAQLHLRNQATVLARQDLFRTVDQSPGHDLAARALLRIGQLYIEEENTNDALAQLRRAQVTGAKAAYEPLATMHIAALHLALGQPDQARIALENHREPLHQDPYRPTAAFLDAYARYLLARQANNTRRETTDLFATLWENKDPNVIGSLGASLMAQAYGDLGFWDHAENWLRKAVSSKKTALAISIEYKLGEALIMQKKRTEAQALFNRLAQAPSRRRVYARFQLARLDLADKNWKDCADKCRVVWKDGGYPDPSAVLQLWGTALEGLGDYSNAARCFAGKAPSLP